MTVDGFFECDVNVTDIQKQKLKLFPEMRQRWMVAIPRENFPETISDEDVKEQAERWMGWVSQESGVKPSFFGGRGLIKVIAWVNGIPSTFEGAEQVASPMPKEFHGSPLSSTPIKMVTVGISFYYDGDETEVVWPWSARGITKTFRCAEDVLRGALLATLPPLEPTEEDTKTLWDSIVETIVEPVTDVIEDIGAKAADIGKQVLIGVGIVAGALIVFKLLMKK